MYRALKKTTGDVYGLPRGRPLISPNSLFELSNRAFRRPDPFGNGRLLAVLHCVQCSRAAQPDEMHQTAIQIVITK